MINSTPSADIASAERFERIGVDAAPKGAARAREEFADWLERFFDLDPIRYCDLVVAVNEALANAAEFAYLLADRPGTMDVQAAYDAGNSTLTVHVCDRGLWRMPATTPPPHAGGRGIPLMRAVSDRTAIETSADGTRVRLEWRGITQR
jgi:serine/threonine-protein kinase RsbW